MSTTWRKCRRTAEQASPRIQELFGPSSSSDYSPSPPRRRRRHGFRKLVKKMVHPRSSIVDHSSSGPSMPKAEYVGVRYRVELNKYVTEIRPTRSTKKIWLGTYDTAEEAARAFDIGNLCCKKNLPLNFPDSSPHMLRRISSRLSPDEARNAIAKLAKEVARVVNLNVGSETPDHSNTEPRTQHLDIDANSAAITYTEAIPPETQHLVEELEVVATSMPFNSAAGDEAGGSGGHAWSFDVTQVFFDDERAHIPLHKLINFGPDQQQQPPKPYGEVPYHYHA